jgi:hypothetical protein
MLTMLHVYDGGQLVEFRRGPCRVWPDLESRELRPDGTPWSEEWFPVDTRTWITLTRHNPELLRALLPELDGSNTMTPRG